MPELPPAEEWLANFADIRSSIRRAVKDVGDDAVHSIRRRTIAGRDITGKSFKDYAEFTQKRKRTGPQPVTLVQTGQMLRALRATAKREDRVEVSIKGRRNQRLAKLHQFGTELSPEPPQIPRRPWFGLSPAQARRLLFWRGREAMLNAFPRDARRSLTLDLTVRL